jgi:hypothetical protein
MRGPTAALEAAHEAGKEESGRILPLDTPTVCKITSNALDVRLGVCRNCRKFYKAGEVRDHNGLGFLVMPEQ